MPGDRTATEPVAPASFSAVAAEAAVAELRKVPDDVRTFSVPYDEAAKRHRIPADVLALLWSHGFSQGAGQEARFDHFDLINIALELHIKSVYSYALRWWGSALDRAARGALITSTVSIIPDCSGGPHDGGCQFSLVLPDGVQHLPEGVEGTVATLNFEGRHDWPELPADVRQLIDDFSHLEFKRLPAAACNLDFARSNNLAQCGGGAELLLAEGRRRGIPIRYSRGLVLSPPFSGIHNWLDVRVEGVWVPIDPSFLKALIRWKLIDGEYWNEYRSPGAVLARFTGVDQPLVRDRGTETTASWPTQQAFS